jgi:hypothetical protein
MDQIPQSRRTPPSSTASTRAAGHPKGAGRSLSFEWWPIERPIPYARNPRVVTEVAVAAVAASIAEYGWRQIIVVDPDGVIVVGHTRLLAAKRLGLTEVPVHIATDLTPQQIKAYRLADNTELLHQTVCGRLGGRRVQPQFPGSHPRPRR